MKQKKIDGKKTERNKNAIVKECDHICDYGSDMAGHDEWFTAADIRCIRPRMKCIIFSTGMKEVFPIWHTVCPNFT